ncbi:hypothetical protein Tco_1199152, partial [Tanacetum coccineum]
IVNDVSDLFCEMGDLHGGLSGCLHEQVICLDEADLLDVGLWYRLGDMRPLNVELYVILD